MARRNKETAEFDALAIRMVELSALIPRRVRYSGDPEPVEEPGSLRAEWIAVHAELVRRFGTPRWRNVTIVTTPDGSVIRQSLTRDLMEIVLEIIPAADVHNAMAQPT